MPMSKQFDSPVKRWPGHVVIKCPVPLEPYTVWRDGIDMLTKDRANLTNGDIADDPAMLREVLPGICAMVEAWELGGDFPKHVTPESYPFIPRIPSLKLTAWLISSINEIVGEEDDLPLA